ncbi:SpoIIE family protein phosphatase [Kitasatospora sp. NPDC006697]|uniref:SpoIIE family protein phosphatase n=1 Tax=Kitasatospora sp. NPDC006697 TaxID=3364020 RepID=UPI00369A7A95
MARKKRTRQVRGARSLAGQVFALQVLVVVLLVLAAVLALVLGSQRDSNTEVRNRSVAVAETFANAPGTAAALHAPDPSAVLDPRAEAARMNAGVDFIVVISPQGIRLTHPVPALIGTPFQGDYLPALQGRTVIQRVGSPIGELVQAVVPLRETDGSVVGAVAAGVTTNRVGAAVDRQLPLVLGTAAGALLLATVGTALVGRRLRRQTHGLGPAEMTRMYEHHDAVLHAVREGVLIIGPEKRGTGPEKGSGPEKRGLFGERHGPGPDTLLLANDEARRLLGLTAEAEGRPVAELDLDRPAAELLASGEPVTDRVLVSKGRVLLVNVRSTALAGGPPGSVVTLRDSTELQAAADQAEAADRRLTLLYEASVAIGTTLDVTRTAEELAEVAVPRFADQVTVDLAETVLGGAEPVPADSLRMRRVALHGGSAAGFYPVGELITVRPGSPQGHSLGTGQAVLDSDLPNSPGWQDQDPERSGQLLDGGVHSVIRVPLLGRGVQLGIAKFWRAGATPRFEAADLSLAEELAARAAVCIDNARRYTREHAMAVTLQRSLLPHDLPEQTALQVASRYLPAQAGVGGDWFDLIPLPGARVALVVGDVVGHGLHAAATMGRLRTAVHNFAMLDLPPDELLGHLDELVARLDQEQRQEPGGSQAVTGAGCLIAVYDPVSRECVMARAGHPPPALVGPDGSVEFPEVPAGPPLGVGGLPFVSARLRPPEGSLLVLYTDGLLEDRERDLDTGLDLLRRALQGSDREPEHTCEEVLAALLPARPVDDVALLVARTRVLPPDRVAHWTVAKDPAAVREVRAAVSRQLDAWGLAEQAFVTELVLSELLTNAIRYAAAPITVRLLHDRVLTCEVADASSTAPHLRYAAETDEGGRGLFLVAQLAERWGTRYTRTGKVIWAEQELG